MAVWINNELLILGRNNRSLVRRFLPWHMLERRIILIGALFIITDLRYDYRLFRFFRVFKGYRRWTGAGGRRTVHEVFQHSFDSETEREREREWERTGTWTGFELDTFRMKVTCINAVCHIVRIILLLGNSRKVSLRRREVSLSLFVVYVGH